MYDDVKALVCSEATQPNNYDFVIILLFFFVNQERAES